MGDNTGSKTRRITQEEDVIDLEESSPGVFSTVKISSKRGFPVEKKIPKVNPLLEGYLQGMGFILKVEDFLERCLDGLDRK